MGVFEKIHAAIEDRDHEGYLRLFHDDYQFVRHQSGTVLDKEAFAGMMRGFLQSEAVKLEKHRKIYENDDILVEHGVMDFPDGSREAVLEVHTLKDGKIIRTETGATPLDK